ncbi:hypothetical protein [Variovorax sp. RKNM96]|uniref:hypothetical protein n=1 Tax=Variovorax sp. RKNM96 TaxID=2681552 RepID=UPI001F122ECA|nr:hypothetical protein [Variovorax sp. RKNM96]
MTLRADMRRTRPARAAVRGMAALACAAGIAATMPAAQADSSTSTSGINVPRSTQASLDFTIAIQKFIFFRIGNGDFPTPGGTTSTVSFTLTPSIPGGPTTPAAGNNTAVNWSGAAPGFTVTPNGNVLPVEVRSNAGQVILRATATAPLANGANTIPLSEITILSSNVNLPAPAIPNTGTGIGVTVIGTSFNNLVTQRNADWTFSYLNSASRTAGTYSGTVTFTASTP